MTDQQPDSPTPAPSSNKTQLRVAVRIIIVVLILAAGLGTALFLKKTAPKAHKVAPTKRAHLVQVQEAIATQAQVSIPCFGQVVAARSVNLQSQVSGQVITVNPQFDVGCRLSAGSEVVQIEPRDYQLAVALQQATVSKAEASLQLELGKQNVARQDWQDWQDGQDGVDVHKATPLALRQPYLQQAQAELLAAQASLEQAQLSLQRTTITTPFDCLVLSKKIDIGTQLNNQTSLGTVVATDAFWVEVSVALDQLSWLDIPAVNSVHGAKASVTLQGRDQPRNGQVIRLLGNLADSSRMARLLVAIPDPLDLQRPLAQRQPLLLGDYVEVTLHGHQLDNVISVPRAAVHDGDQLWIATADNTLDIRQVHILWKERHQVFIDSGVTAGEQIIVSDLASAVDGLSIKITDAAESQE